MRRKPGLRSLRSASLSSRVAEGGARLSTPAHAHCGRPARSPCTIAMRGRSIVRIASTWIRLSPSFRGSEFFNPLEAELFQRSASSPTRIGQSSGNLAASGLEPRPSGASNGMAKPTIPNRSRLPSPFSGMSGIPRTAPSLSLRRHEADNERDLPRGAPGACSGPCCGSSPMHRVQRERQGIRDETSALQPGPP